MSSAGVRLNLGSGDKPTPDGWTSVDADGNYGPDLVADVTALPFDDGSVERIFAAHLCEHIPLPQLPSALAEWRRLMAPDGVLMLVGPCIDKAVRQNQPSWLLEAIIAHGGPPHGHAWTCSTGILQHFLEAAGWDVDEVSVTTVHLPEWPNAVPDALWQYALVCR
jgi:SAM-dependent methyltransferase